jgi:dTDP-4-dehydrorhamnose reductase
MIKPSRPPDAVSRVVIFGKGQLGRELDALFSPRCEVQSFDLPEVDIAEEGSIAAVMADMRPDVVLNAAAYTDVEKAESEREAAFRVNEQGAAVVAAAARKYGARCVYYSTDFVFDRPDPSPCEPDDAVAPKGVYAESKEAGEKAVRAEDPAHLIIRTAWLYGPGGNNFVEKIIRAAGSRPELRVVEDQVGSPTHTEDLAAATAALLNAQAAGTFHAVNDGLCSRYEFAKAILELAGLDTPVHPCSSDEFPTAAPRPRFSVLSNQRLLDEAGFSMRGWREALERYMDRRQPA